MSRFLLATIFLLATFPFTARAESSLYVSPDIGVYTIGEIFEIKVLADTGGQKINAAEAELTFNPDALEVQRILTHDSILESWPTPPVFSNEKGTVRFSGWTKRNYEGKDGLLVTIRFKAKTSQSSNAYLAAGAILAADGRGSNIITSMKSGLYTVGAQHVVPAIPEPGDILPEESRIDPDAVPAEIEQIGMSVVPETPAFDKEFLNISAGERIVINGKSPPNSKVVFFLSRGDEKEKYSAVTSDNEGVFTFISDQGAREGVYRLRAAVQDANGQISRSARVTITARAEGVAAAVGVTTQLMFATMPLLTLLVLGGLGAGFLVHKHNVERMRRPPSRR
jgi:Cohesin domain